MIKSLRLETSQKDKGRRSQGVVRDGGETAVIVFVLAMAIREAWRGKGHASASLPQLTRRALCSSYSFSDHSFFSFTSDEQKA